MDLIDRYLGAVRWNLPAAKADDIIAELADVIANRIEEREDKLGRPLKRNEISAVLKEFGHPIEVAGRYHGQRVLIGPELFPFYWFALRVVLVIVAAIEVIQVAARAVIGSEPLIRALSDGGSDFINALLTNGALVTLAFAVIEHTGLLTRYLERWKPEELPTIRISAPRRRPWEPLSEIVFGVVFILWWTGVFTLPLVPSDSRVVVTPAAVWATLFWPVLGLAALGLLRALANLAAPGAKPIRTVLTIARAAAFIAFAAMLHGAGQLVTVSSGVLEPGRVAEIQQSLDLALRIAILAVPLIITIQGAVDIWRIYRER